MKSEHKDEYSTLVTGDLVTITGVGMHSGKTDKSVFLRASPEPGSDFSWIEDSDIHLFIEADSFYTKLLTCCSKVGWISNEYYRIEKI